MHQVVQVNLPEKLGVCGLGKMAPGEFTSAPVTEKLLVHTKSALTGLFLGTGVQFYRSIRTLFIDSGLRSKLVGYEKVGGNLRVPGGKFVDAGGAVPKMLTSHKYRHFDVELEVNHFEWGVMVVTHKIPDEPLV
jgi:hypothetical protein